MEYAIGIDSGGTNYRLRAVSSSGETLAQYVGQPANHYHLGMDMFPKVVNDNISSLLALFGGDRNSCRALYCGTTGLDSPEDGEFLNAFYRTQCGLSCPVSVVSDSELALGAVTGGEGILLISGTGAIAFGKTREGVTARAGGWLFSILGDQGGGSWVSRRAMQLLSRYFDGAICKTEMISELCIYLNIQNRNDLNKIARKAGEPPWELPPLGKIVSRYAEQGNEDAVAIFKEAADHVFSIVTDLDHILSMSKNWPDFPIGLWGSTILGSSVMRDYFSRLVKERYPLAKIVLPTSKTALDEASSQALRLWQGR